MILNLDGLTKKYGATLALNDLNLAMRAGSLVALLGPAGAGKTTTLRLVAGLEEPDSGRIRIAGRDMAGVPPHGRDVAMIFDNLALYPGKTGFENIAFPLRVARRDGGEIKRRVLAVAETLRIGHILDRLPRTMSGGERQRVALGRALVREPSLFLLDEPLSSLDAMLRLDLRAELRRLQAERGYSFLMTTPDHSEALAVADVVLVLDKGRTLQIGAPQDVYDFPVDRATARFVGAPQINILPARLESDDGLRARFGSSMIVLPPALAARLPARVFSIEIGVRPEDVILASPGGGAMQGAALDVEPLGLHCTVTVDLPGGRVVASLGPDHSIRPRVGDLVGLSFRADRLHAFDPDSGRRF